MNLDSLIERGRLPWRPNGAVTGVDVLYEYETPLVGIFEVHHATFLFQQVLDSEQGLSVWAYAKLDPAATQTVRNITFASVDDLRTWTERHFQGMDAVLALARNGRLAGFWTRSSVDNNILASVDLFLSDIIKSVEDVPDINTRLRAKIAGLDAASSELVGS